MDLGISGLASGFDWKNLVEQLADVERVPQTRLRVEQSTLDQRKIAYGSISTQFGVLKNRVDALKDPTLFESRLATTGDSEVASASASAGSALGTYTFAITQLATTSLQQGGSNAGLKLNSTNDVSSLVLSGAGFANPVTAGTFTVNGKQVTIATTDTLAAVFTKISTATGGAVTGAYNNATDKITLSGTGAIVLGSATDSSNFLRIAKLENNGTNTIASAVALGTIKQTATLNEGNFTTAISDGGSGNGQFKINGVAIAFNASTDTTADVIARINNSTAGVVAAYDAVNDRFQLTNKSTGDVGIALEDVTGNFLAGTGLSSGSLSRGHNLLYTINGGGQLSHHSNTITDESSSLTGLTVTALKEGSTTIQTTSDTSKITAAVKDFIGEYNKSQSLIDSHTASTTDAKGKVTAGILAGENEANELSSKLRGLANSVVSGLSGSVSQLVHLGIDSNGTDDTLALADSTTLDTMLADHLSEVQEFFTHATRGLGVKLSSYLDGVVGDKGSLVTKQKNLTTQSANIDTQISDLERIVLANKSRLIASFVSMEQARSNINQQLQFLSQRFGTQASV